MGQQPRRVSFLLLPTMLQGVRTSRLKPVQKLRLVDAEPPDHLVERAHRVTAQRPSPSKPPRGGHRSGQPSPPRSRPTPPRGAEAGSGGAESRPARSPSPAVEDSLLPGAQPVRLGRHGVRKLHELAAEGGLTQQQDRGVHAGGPGRGEG